MPGQSGRRAGPLSHLCALVAALTLQLSSIVVSVVVGRKHGLTPSEVIELVELLTLQLLLRRWCRKHGLTPSEVVELVDLLVWQRELLLWLLLRWR